MSNKNVDYKILQNIFKNADTKKRSCFLCSEHAINSHLLQKNGILNYIATNNHIIQIEPNDFFNAEKKGVIDVKRIGVNNAMSYNLFCNRHDTDIFKSIESTEIDFNSYKSQLLFSYRAFCAEIRKKIVNIDVYERILRANTFATNYDFLESVQLQLSGNQKGLEHMSFYRSEFENDLASDLESFHFKTINLSFIPLCASAVYSPINRKIHNWNFFNNEDKRLNYLFINIVPYHKYLKLIIGYHKQQVDEWILNYIKDWVDCAMGALSKKLTDLISTKIETWAISPDYFDKIDGGDVKLFKQYWNSNAMNLDLEQSVNFDLFKNIKSED